MWRMKRSVSFILRDPRFGATGPDPGTYITVSNTSSYLRLKGYVDP